MAGGRSFGSRLFRIRIAKSPGPTRIAAVAPQKVAKTAAARNRLRRLVYEAVRPMLEKLRPDREIIIFAGAQATKASLSEISDDLGIFFVKSGLLK